MGTRLDKCPHEGRCFARRNGECEILLNTFFWKRKCPFQKPDMEVTNGKTYPFDWAYEKRSKNGKENE